MVASFMESTLVFAVLLLITSIILIYTLISKRKQLVDDLVVVDLGTESIKVPEIRFIIISAMLCFVGFIEFSLGLSLLSNFKWNDPSLYAGSFFLLLGILAFYIALKLFLRKNNVIQVVIGPTALSYKPKKWYSSSRGPSGVNGASALFSNEMITTPYAEIRDIIFYESKWAGNYIRLMLKKGDKISLILVTNNNAQVKEVYLKIKEKMLADPAHQNYEPHPLRFN